MKDFNYYMNLSYRMEIIEDPDEGGYVIPEPNELDKYSGQFKIRMPKSLHRALAEQSHKEGISMNQYCVYLLAQNNVICKKVAATIKTS